MEALRVQPPFVTGYPKTRRIINISAKLRLQDCWMLDIIDEIAFNYAISRSNIFKLILADWLLDGKRTFTTELIEETLTESCRDFAAKALRNRALLDQQNPDSE